MFKVLRLKTAELAGDDSGVALAFTVTVSLAVFLFGFAVYACGEIVRERIELQNASDAAAYSGALVQADTISRIAVINKAMAWNYVMMTRRQMDHIMDNFLGLTVSAWNNACNVTRTAEYTCSCHMHVEGWNWRVGVTPGGGGGEVTHRLIRLNESQDVFIPQILAARAAHAASNPVSQLTALRRCIDSMNRAEKALISGMKKRIEHAVEYCVKSDVSLTENDRAIKNSGKVNWTIYDLKNASVYFEALNGDESRFLRFGGFSGPPRQALGAGADVWLKQTASQGFRRDYAQTGSTLSARWFTYNQVWYHTTFCVFGGIIVLPAGAVTGAMAQDAFFKGQTAGPQVLKSNFFSPDGSIVVGVSRPVNNPLAFVFGGGDKPGIYSAFTVGGGRQTMWGVSGARAGYRLSGWRQGEYCSSTVLPQRENLCVTAWDAMVLPPRDKKTTSSGMLAAVAKKLGVSGEFAGKDRLSGYSKLAFSDCAKHLYH